MYIYYIYDIYYVFLYRVREWPMSMSNDPIRIAPYNWLIIARTKDDKYNIIMNLTEYIYSTFIGLPMQISILPV